MQIHLLQACLKNYLVLFQVCPTLRIQEDDFVEKVEKLRIYSYLSHETVKLFLEKTKIWYLTVTVILPYYYDTSFLLS